MKTMLTSGLLALAAFTFFRAEARETTAPQCRVFVTGYHHTKVWSDEKVKIEIDAKDACQEHFLSPMKLRLVQVRVIQNGEVVRRYFSSGAHYSQSTGQLLLRDVLVSVDPLSKTPTRTQLVLNVKDGGIRSPGGPRLSIFKNEI